MAQDLRGRTFGRLKIGKSAEPVRRRGRTCWLCRCACGALVTVRADKLLGHETGSCGCARADSEVRQAASLSVPLERRRAAGRAAAKARWG